MGGGSWTTSAFVNYSHATNKSVSMDGTLTASSHQEIFKTKNLDPALNPKNVIRECCDSAEHPNTVPVILALDVTGSMGQAAVEVAKKLNTIMTKLYDEVKDVEFMIMGIGDLAYDYHPIQASQFESDIRIAEQLDKVFFEFHGGGNSYESYTAAWYFGLKHTKLDCWKRGKKGIIITMGDERLNPYLPIHGRHCGLASATGDSLQDDIETKDLYKDVVEKFDVYHLNVEHGYNGDKDNIEKSFKEYMDEKHFRNVNLDSIVNEIVDIVVSAANGTATSATGAVRSDEGISW